MTRMSRDRKIIAGLLLALVVEFVLLLLHSGVIHFGGSTWGGRQAGHVKQAHNQLRRRNLNSLVWESSEEQEPVFYHDSVLTLKESTASLELENSTEVKLSENTLITIEPPDEKHTGEIHLRFMRGNLQARNPFKKSSIEGESWSVELKSGSDLELREVGDQAVEIQVKGGGGSVTSSSGTSDLVANQIVRIGKTGTKTFALNDSVKWLNPPQKRIYLHGESIPLQIEWSGKATELLIQTLGQAERRMPLPPGASHFLADIDFGSHRLTLRNDQSSSEPLDVQVWRAPLVHLLFPLPRNRVDIGESVKFIWQKNQQLSSYRLHMNDQIEKRNENLSFQTFKEEQDLQWYVEGVDHDGFLVPPLYRYPLFIREKPLPAPRLKAPELRAPASERKPPGPGAMVLSWLLPFANADETLKFQAVFSWEPVPGADQYVIEISESADFRDPVIAATLKSTEYVWDGLRLQNYYWRVAAGHSTGKLGVFTEPVAVDFAPLKKNASIAALNGVLIRKVAKPKKVVDIAPVAVVEEKSPAPLAPEPVKHEALTEAQKNWRPILLWQPKYGLIHVKGSQDTTADFNGVTVPSFGFEFPWIDSNEALWLFDASMSYFTFAPDPKTTYPFQDDVGWLEYEFAFQRFRNSVGYGFAARQILSLQRSDLESVNTSTSLGFGPTVQKNFPQSRGDINVRAELIFNRDGQALVLMPEWRCRIGPRLTTGLGIEGALLIDGTEFGYHLQGYFTVGFPF